MKIDFMVAEVLKKWLSEHGCCFDVNGFPILPENCYESLEPNYLAPWHHRNFYPKANTSICFCIPDERIYPRFEKVFDEIKELKKYQSICSMDLSVSKNMNREMQNFNMLLNSFYTAVLAYSDIKIIPSLRCGDASTIRFLINHKKAPLWLLGIHGNSRNCDVAAYDEYILRSEFLFLRPKEVLLYGNPSKREKNILDDIEMPYRVYEDFRKFYKNGRPF